MWCSSSLARLGRLLGWLGLACWLGACSTGPTSIGVGLPAVDPNSGAYLLDTLTVRASTVLRDSVATSASNYLLVGRAADRQLGTLTATSFVQLTLGGQFAPDNNAVFDSVTLRLIPDTGNYRYGDTTQRQALVRVYPLTQPLPTTGPLYATPRYTNLSANYTPTDASLLNRRSSDGTNTPLVPQRRASPSLTVIRVQLNPAVGERLLAAAKASPLTTEDQLQELLPGLVLAPGDNDRAALVRLLANSGEAGVLVYYHNPTDPTIAQSHIFPINGGRHCFQVTADRTGAAIQGLPSQPGDKFYAEATGNQTVIEGGIGLQTRLEFPYLSNLRDLGQTLTIASAQLTAEVPPTTLEPYLPAPPTLAVLYANASNQPIATYPGSLTYGVAVSPVTALDLGSYSLSLTTYIQGVLTGAIPNNGLLLLSSTPELPTRVVLGGPRHPTNPLKLRLYVIRTGS